MIDKQVFGRTGHMSSRAIFGAAALGRVTQSEADQTLDLLLKYGVNHIDTAASYGESELRIGPWMDHHRQDFFLATKTGKRTYQEARDEIHRSLERLHVSSVDLIQLHYLVGEEEWKVAMGPGGVLEAVIEAREQGLTRFIGVTGHDVEITIRHQESLGRFDFDSVLLPYSYIMMKNPIYATELEKVFKIAQERNAAIQTIKSITRRPWPAGAPQTAATWYEPMTEQTHIDHAVHWILGRPGIFLNTVGDIYVLPKVLDAVSRFEQRPSDEVMEADISALEMSPLFV